MTQQRSKKEISLGEDFDDVVVKVNGATINVSAAGYVIAGSPCELSIGAVMKDGTIYAGISPDTNKPMYATPADASLTMKFNEAQKYAAKLDAHHHHTVALQVARFEQSARHRRPAGETGIACPARGES